MPWHKVDDRWHDHPKVRRLLPVTHPLALWSVAGSWCAGTSHDGFVPRSVALRWVKGATALTKMASELVEVGLWETGEVDAEPGWWFHDWADRNPTAEQVAADRKAAAERQRKARDKAKGSRRDGAESHGVTNGVSHGPPDPTRPEDTPQPPAERGAEVDPGHDGTHRNCRACGTNRRGPTVAPVAPLRVLPDAADVMAAALPAVASPPPPGFRDALRGGA